MSPPSLTSLPPPTPSHLSRLSQSTRLRSLCHTANSHFLSILGMEMYVSMFLSLFIPSSPFPTVTSLFSMSASLLLPCNQVHQCHFSRFHIYASIYVFVFLFQTYFTLYNRLQAHPHHSIDLNLFLLMLSNISLYTCTSTSLSIHLCCFHVLTIVNIAVMHIGIHVSFSVMVSSEYVPSSGIAGSFGSFIPQFLKESRYSSP